MVGFYVHLNMPMRLFMVFLCLLACKTAIQAQVSPGIITIEGEIRDAETKDPVPYVHIMNKAAGLGTVSNTEGRFWIKMDQTDTLLFSAIGFEPYAFVLNPSQRSRRLRVTIEMNTSTQVLKPVNVFAYRDEESLKQALIEMDPGPAPEEEKVVIPGVRSTPIDANPSFKMGGPISFFYNKFSRKAKAEKQLQQDIASYDYRKVLKAKYNEQVVLELTGLPEDEVEAFMNFCKIEEAFVEVASEYQIALKVSSCLVKFKNQ